MVSRAKNCNFQKSALLCKDLLAAFSTALWILLEITYYKGSPEIREEVYP